VDCIAVARNPLQHRHERGDTESILTPVGEPWLRIRFIGLNEAGMIEGHALVLLSGGQDSTTCLAWALERFAHVETIGFDYGQRHAVELTMRDTVRREIVSIRDAWRERLGPDHMISLAYLGEIGTTAMTSEMEISFDAAGLPNTFVPARNLAFLTAAAAVAYRRGLKHIVGGMCETDYSGYPDCRDDTIKAQQAALSLGLGQPVVIHTPLMWLTKADTWAMTQELGGDALVDLVVEHTHTCYLGDRTHRHAWGYGCGACPACELRAAGHAQWLAQ
jgi:7-cyano-7-deazaguanine synthase